MSRVKLFQLSESVSVVTIKGESEQGHPSIMVSFYTENETDYFSFGFESVHESEASRDENFKEDHSAQLIRLFNQIVTKEEYPVELLPEKPVADIEVKEPKKAD